MSSVGERDSLGRTIIAYRGHITRIINELDPLLLEKIASKEVVEKHSSLVSIFEKLKRACAQWYHLSGEQEDRERITHDYATLVGDRSKEFQVEITINDVFGW